MILLNILHYTIQALVIIKDWASTFDKLQWFIPVPCMWLLLTVGTKLAVSFQRSLPTLAEIEGFGTHSKWGQHWRRGFRTYCAHAWVRSVAGLADLLVNVRNMATLDNPAPTLPLTQGRNQWCNYPSYGIKGKEDWRIGGLALGKFFGQTAFQTSIEVQNTQGRGCAQTEHWRPRQCAASGMMVVKRHGLVLRQGMGQGQGTQTGRLQDFKLGDHPESVLGMIPTLQYKPLSFGMCLKRQTFHNCHGNTNSHSIEFQLETKLIEVLPCALEQCLRQAIMPQTSMWRESSAIKVEM